jgi:hypothetical protein
MVVKACLLGHINDPYKQKLLEAVRKLVESYSMSMIRDSSGRMHLMKEIYLDVMDIKTVEALEEFFNKTFIRHLMLGTGETSRKSERVHDLRENIADFRFNRTRYRGDWRIYAYGAMKHFTILQNHVTMNLERFLIRSVFVPYPGLSYKAIWAIIGGITNDRQKEQDIEFFDKKASHWSMNEASVKHAAIQEHRAILGLDNPAAKGISYNNG